MVLVEHSYLSLVAKCQHDDVSYAQSGVRCPDVHAVCCCAVMPIQSIATPVNGLVYVHMGPFDWIRMELDTYDGHVSDAGHWF